jgi:hypothetical protein
MNLFLELNAKNAGYIFQTKILLLGNLENFNLQMLRVGFAADIPDC